VRLYRATPGITPMHRVLRDAVTVCIWLAGDKLSVLFFGRTVSKTGSQLAFIPHSGGDDLEAPLHARYNSSVALCVEVCMEEDTLRQVGGFGQICSGARGDVLEGDFVISLTSKSELHFEVHP